MSSGYEPGAPAYARFARRVQAACIDGVVLLLIMVAALLIATSMQSDNVGRVLGYSFAAVFLLYEPLLVSLTGGTLGHRYCNMRVVDDGTGGNVNFFKAVIRVAIKTIFGWYSFILMTATSRHQALHDMMTRSTVQIRNVAKAQSFHIARVRLPLPDGAPSRTRRAFVIAGYIVGWTILSTVIFVNLTSDVCLTYDRCSAAERWAGIVLELAWLLVCAVVVGFGWRGRLWGARIRTSP